MTRELALCLMALAYVAFAAAQSGPGLLVLVASLASALGFMAVYRRSQVAAGRDRVSLWTPSIAPRRSGMIETSSIPDA